MTKVVYLFFVKLHEDFHTLFDFARLFYNTFDIFLIIKSAYFFFEL